MWDYGVGLHSQSVHAATPLICHLNGIALNYTGRTPHTQNSHTNSFYSADNITALRAVSRERVHIRYIRVVAPNARSG